jgi:branched-chain amino acid transport system ATP-binding protein
VSSVSEPLLTLDGVETFYGSIQALKGISFKVPKGSIVTLLGANGAGKSTTLKCISGLVSPARGTVSFRGRRIDRLPSETIVRLGISHVPEGRGLFPELTVWENLRMGARGKLGVKDAERVVGYFPWIERRRDQPAATLSGGEQQMLALGRALASRPRLLMLDEPSLGLAPTIVRELFAAVRRLNEEDGLTVLVVEQNATIALEVAARAYVLEVGKVAVEGTSDELRRHEGVRKSYLGY